MTSNNVINLTIDGQQVTAKPGDTVMDAALAAGIDIPRLCYHPKLTDQGACRLCVVEVEGGRGLPAACTLPVSEGMNVHTESDEITEARRVILELIIANHPLDCMTNCALQDYAYRYSVGESPYAGHTKNHLPDLNNPFIMRDHNKCILCGRCVRVCDEIQGLNVLQWTNRGFDTKVTTAFDVPLEESPCVFCGNCVAVCPTGALQSVQSLGRGRTWELERVTTTCPYCGVGCELDLLVKDGQIRDVEPADGPANEGWACVKGRYGWDFVNDEDRLTSPLIREGDEFREASWDEALDLVAQELGATRDEFGPDAVAGLASAKCTNEENYLFQKFIRAVIGTNTIDHCARL